MQIRSLMTSQVLLVIGVKTQNQKYLCKYVTKVIETWHQHFTLRNTPHGAYFDVAMATHLFPVFFLFESNITNHDFKRRSKWSYSKHT